MGFGGEVHDRVHARQDAVEQVGVADVAVHELVSRRVGHGCQVLEVPRVGEGVEHDHVGAFEARVGVFEGAPNEVRADEAGTAGYQDSHCRHHTPVAIKTLIIARSRGRRRICPAWDASVQRARMPRPSSNRSICSSPERVSGVATRSAERAWMMA